MIECLRRSAATIERRTTAEGSLTYAAGQSLGQARQLHAAASEIEHLHNLLNARDKFIVERGLWDEFANQLPERT